MQDPTCDCGQEEQMMQHILFRYRLGPHCKDSDLRNATEEALAWLSHWRGKIWIIILFLGMQPSGNFTIPESPPPGYMSEDSEYNETASSLSSPGPSGAFSGQ